MAKFKIFGSAAADAEIRGADSVIDPLLVGAKITTIEVNGEQVAATSEQVPLKLKIAAFAATVKQGSGDNELSQMIVNNTLLADQAKAFETRAVTAETNAATITRENGALAAELEVQKAAVARLTAENAEVITLRKAANTEAGRVTADFNALNSEISATALRFDVLSDLRDEKQVLLDSKATPAEKQSAAERVPAADKLKAIGGAVNAALARTGVNVASLPAGGTAHNAGSLKMARAEFLKLEAKAQTKFFADGGKLTD